MVDRFRRQRRWRSLGKVWKQRHVAVRGPAADTETHVYAVYLSTEKKYTVSQKRSTPNSWR